MGAPFPAGNLARRRTRALLVALALCSAAVPPGGAHAEACPGSGPRACPYAGVRVIGQRAEGVLRFPEAVALGPGGDVYVADQLSYVVQKFSAAGQFEREWGSYGGGHGQFGPIGGLAVDGAGDVYVVDSSRDRVEKFDANGNFLLAWGRSGSEAGQFRFFSSQNPSQPPGGGIAVAGGFVYVADSGNNRIERFNLNGGEALAWGTKGSGPGQFSYPRGVAANAQEVLVADDDNHRIQKFEPELNFHGAWGGFGSKPGQLAFPRALAADAAGDTYVADTANDRVEVFDPEGNLLRTFGASRRAAGVMTAPRGLAADPTGRLLVSDTIDNRLELFAPGSGAFAGSWDAAGGPRPGYKAPAGIAVDGRGSLYVADQGNERVVHLWGDGTYLSELGGPALIGGAQLSGAGALAVSAATAQLYVADSNHNRVLVYAPDGVLLARWGAGGGSGAPGAGPGEFRRPSALALDAAGDVYVTDTGNDRVVELAPDGSPLRQWGSRGSADGRFHAPYGIAVDSAGHVLVLDAENNRVQEFDAGGRFLTSWGRRGIGPGELSQARALALDCAGSVYVADTNNNRVERFDGVSPGARGCVAPGAWPPPLDIAPALRVRLARRAGVLARRALALTVSCPRGCTVRATGTLRGGARTLVGLIPAARALPAGALGHLRLRVSSLALRRLRGALGGGTAISARVRLLATGPTGRRALVVRRYRVAR